MSSTSKKESAGAKKEIGRRTTEGHPWMHLITGTYAGRYTHVDDLSVSELTQVVRRVRIVEERLSASLSKLRTINASAVDIVGKDRLLEGLAFIERMAQIVAACTDQTESRIESDN